MPKNTATTKAKESIEAIEQKLGETQEVAADKLASTAENLHERSDNVKEFLSEKAEKIEDTVRTKTYEAGDLTQQTIEKVNKIGHKAADVVESSSDYVRDFDPTRVKETVIMTVREKPELTIAAAGLFGLFLGFLVGRKSR